MQASIVCGRGALHTLCIDVRLMLEKRLDNSYAPLGRRVHERAHARLVQSVLVSPPFNQVLDYFDKVSYGCQVERSQSLECWLVYVFAVRKQ